MQQKIIPILSAAVAAVSLMGSLQAAQEHDPSMHAQQLSETQQMNSGAATADSRPLVHFPEPMRLHTLSNMRDHLLALSEIQEALAREQFEEAGDIAEHRLGMSAMRAHGAAQRSQFMPEAMAGIGSEMHHAASRFAVASNDAAVSGDVKPALAALSEVIRQCVACHNGFRVQ